MIDDAVLLRKDWLRGQTARDNAWLRGLCWARGLFSHSQRGRSPGAAGLRGCTSEQENRERKCYL